MQGGAPTLYGTVYATLTRYYLTGELDPTHIDIEGILDCQEPSTGLFSGPELADMSWEEGGSHSQLYCREHTTATVLPLLEELGVKPRHALQHYQQFLDLQKLGDWYEHRNWTDSWLEGNNLLFMQQGLRWLTNFEGNEKADAALLHLFDLLDRDVDPRTGMWGSDRGSSVANSVFGSYHQLLAYHFYGRPAPHPAEAVDTVLSLQFADGGFAQRLGGGACEDVDAVDILVNTARRSQVPMRRVVAALRRCRRHILAIQSVDGGFPYNPTTEFCHHGVPATRTQQGQSDAFSTWFRAHTLLLIESFLKRNGAEAYFSSGLSMGWHDEKPRRRSPWLLSAAQRMAELSDPMPLLRQAKWLRVRLA